MKLVLRFWDAFGRLLYSIAISASKFHKKTVAVYFGNKKIVIPSITTTAMSRANEGVDATGFKEAPFRSRRKYFCFLLLKPRLALFVLNHPVIAAFVLHQPSIRSAHSDHDSSFELPLSFSGRQGAHSKARPYLKATG